MEAIKKVAFWSNILPYINKDFKNTNRWDLNPGSLVSLRTQKSLLLHHQYPWERGLDVIFEIVFTLWLKCNQHKQDLKTGLQHINQHALSMHHQDN